MWDSLICPIHEQEEQLWSVTSMRALLDWTLEQPPHFSTSSFKCFSRNYYVIF